MIDDILNMVGNLPLPGFFVTVQCAKEADYFPSGLESFILEKAQRIRQGVNTRKFIYHDKEWRLIITFFPTDQVVDERYALKNHIP